MKPFYSPLYWVLSLTSFLLPTSAATLSQRLISPAHSLSSISFSDLVPNSTSLTAINPAKFQIGMRYHKSITLPPTSVLMNVVDVMVQLALQDFESPMTRKVFALDTPRYSNVEIIIRPWNEASSATMLSGFAVLGLYDVIQSILSDPKQRFREIFSNFVYDGVDVGWLRIKRRTEPIASSNPRNDSSFSTAQPALPPSSQTARSPNGIGELPQTTNETYLSTAAWDDPHLDVTVTQGRAILTVYELFLAVLTFISELALSPRTSHVQDFTMTIIKPPITATGQHIVIAFKNRRTAAHQPYLQVEWLIKAFGRLPQYMLARGAFRDVRSMAVRVDGVEVGTGYMVKEQAAAGSPADVSSA